MKVLYISNINCLNAFLNFVNVSKKKNQRTNVVSRGFLMVKFPKTLSVKTEYTN